MSDPYDFFAPPRTGTPAPPPAQPAPGAAANGFGTPAQPPTAPAQGYGAPAPGFGAPQGQFGAFGGAPQVPPPTAYPGAPGHASPRPGTVVAAAVLAFVQSGFALLAGVFVVFAGFAARDAANQIGSTGNGESTSFTVTSGEAATFGGNALDSLGAVAIVIGLVVLAIGALLVFLGLKVLAGALWAAITLSVFEGVLLLGALGEVLDGDLGGTILVSALPVAVLACLWTKQAKTWIAAH